MIIKMETDKGAFEVVYSQFYSNIGSSNTKIGCSLGFAADFVCNTVTYRVLFFIYPVWAD